MQAPQHTVSVEDYTRYFVKKIVKDEKFRDTAELRSAGNTFYALLQRFAREGDREDVRTPFKIMKDEFMNEWKSSCKETRDELIRRLFSVLDVVHEECQSSVQNCVNGTEVSSTILEEFRLRLMKMVVGDTWKDALPLRMEALKHMHKYRNRELDGYYTQESRKNTLKHKARNLTVKKLKRSVVGPAKASWTAVFNDLLLSSGARLAPLLFAILDENQAMEERLLSITIPSKGTDTGSNRGGSMLSAESRSSVSSSSAKVGNSDADVCLPTTDEDTSSPYYFKNLTSELNAKLQLFKKKGAVHVPTAALTRNSSQETGSAISNQNPFRGLDDDAFTLKSDELRSLGSQVLDGGEAQRSVTPFLDEPPPPWCLPDAQFQLSDGDVDPTMSPSGFRMRSNQRTQLRLLQSNSAKTSSRTHQQSQHHLQKSPSYHTSHTFSSASSLSSQPQSRDRHSHKKISDQGHNLERSSHHLFEESDPFNAATFE